MGWLPLSLSMSTFPTQNCSERRKALLLVRDFVVANQVLRSAQCTCLTPRRFLASWVEAAARLHSPLISSKRSLFAPASSPQVPGQVGGTRRLAQRAAGLHPHHSGVVHGGPHCGPGRPAWREHPGGRKGEVFRWVRVGSCDADWLRAAGAPEGQLGTHRMLLTNRCRPALLVGCPPHRRWIAPAGMWCTSTSPASLTRA